MNRLRAYRRIEGITQSQLAEKLGISRRLVSAIEAGSRTPPKDISPLGYSSERIEIAEMTEPLHRQMASTRVSATQRATELLRVAGEAFQDLSQVLNRRSRTPRLEPLGPIRSDADLAEAVNEVRVGILQIEEHRPIKNLTDKVERAGICLIPIIGLPGIDGISSWVGNSPRYPVIGLNPDVPGDRFRMSLAHEVAHLALHTRRTAHSEPEAYRFASLLLIDDDDFIAAMPDRPPVLRDFVRLKAIWGVSAAALVYRANQLGFLNERSYRSIQMQMSAWRKNEPASFRSKPGRLLPYLVEKHGGIHLCGRMLGLKPDHLREVTAWHRLRIVPAADEGTQ